jgi:hypothetical protein
MQCNGREIRWEHILQLYRGDVGKASGLALVPKLKYEHVHLTSFSKMRVDLAAQVRTFHLTQVILHLDRFTIIKIISRF